MARNLQNRYTVLESAIVECERLERKTGKPYYVKTDDLGYYYPAIDRTKLAVIGVIQAVHAAKKFKAMKAGT